jgi:hypothetical protein
MDVGCPNRSNFDRALEKINPTARRILATLSMAMQRQPKFGGGLHRRGLTELSMGYPPLLLPGPLAVAQRPLPLPPGSAKFCPRPAETPHLAPMENTAAATDPSFDAVDVAVTGSIAATAPTASTDTTAKDKAKVKVKKELTTAEREVENQKRQA